MLGRFRAMKQTLIAFAVLVIAHTAVSFGAYRWLTRVSDFTPLPPELIGQPETTTPEQRARGERSFFSPDTIILKRFVPMPVLFYAWAGYLALIAALALAWWQQYRSAA